MKKAIALIRVSTDRQAKKDRGGIPGQRAEIEAIAQRESLAIDDWVQLEGVSGTRVLDDPRFRALLDRIESPEIDGVIVADLDRLMRPEDPGTYTIFRRFRR